MRTERELRKLRTSGFRPLRDGRIHMRCPRCGRKQSNTPRQKYDPPKATLAELHCPKCGAGDKDGWPEFFDANGVSIPDADPMEGQP